MSADCWKWKWKKSEADKKKSEKTCWAVQSGVRRWSWRGGKRGNWTEKRKEEEGLLQQVETSASCRCREPALTGLGYDFSHRKEQPSGLWDQQTPADRLQTAYRCRPDANLLLTPAEADLVSTLIYLTSEIIVAHLFITYYLHYCWTHHTHPGFLSIWIHFKLYHLLLNHLRTHLTSYNSAHWVFLCVCFTLLIILVYFRFLILLLYFILFRLWLCDISVCVCSTLAALCFLICYRNKVSGLLPRGKSSWMTQMCVRLLHMWRAFILVPAAWKP